MSAPPAGLRLLTFPPQHRKRQREKLSPLVRKVMALEARNPDGEHFLLNNLVDRLLAMHGDRSAQARVNATDLELARAREHAR